MGGPSRERDISLKSGQAVVEALRAGNCDVQPLPFSTPALPPIAQDTDVVFPALHGEFGEDGQVQKLLEQAGWAYVGCDVVASACILDKEATKATLSAAGIRCPQGTVIHQPDAPCPQKLPVIVKPNKEGSTLGLTLVQTPEQWTAALKNALAHDQNVVVEEFIAGKEITVSLLFGRALPVVEIVPPGDIFDFDAKYVYQHGQTTYHCPPVSIPESQQKEAQKIAESAFSILQARDLLRVDMIIDAATGIPVVLEGNSMPGFTATSLMPKAAATAGISFPQLCRRLVDAAAGRCPHRKNQHD